MNETTDSLIKDAANGYHGEAHFSSKQEVSGVVGDAFSISSSDDFIELPKSAYFPEGSEQATLSFWSYNFSDELSNQTLFHASSAQGTHLKVQLPAVDGALHWITGSGGGVDEVSYPLQGFNDRWIYWTIQIDLLSGKSSIYQDGAHVLTQSGISLPFGAQAEAFRIGSDTDGLFSWQGLIDEVRISDYLVEPERIEAFYQNQRLDDHDFLTLGNVQGPPILVSIEKLQSFKGKHFSASLTSFPADTGTFSAVGLPAGLAINNTTGEISGTPVQNGQYQVTIIVKNEFGQDSKSLPMSVFDPSAFPKQIEFNCSNYPGTTTLIDFPC